jgi:UDP-2-acetamido-3-amino-2,3-dideoxy-glucuronate N-acetyltransferase
MVFTNIVNPRSAVIRKDSYVTTIVEKGATIGANSTIICGNRIGAFSFIGAGAVVTRDVKPYALVMGNPARQKGWMSEFGHKLNFDDKGFAICPESGEKYRIQDGNVLKVN